MDNTNENQTSAVKKAAHLTNDVLFVTALVMSAVGLGKLTYDSVKFGSQKIKSWKSSKKEK